MICNIGNPKHPLILGSNRDEFFDRLTQPATFVTSDIIMPMDLQRKEHGTWIGMNKKNGKLCILLNFHEKINQMGLMSRGSISRSFLESELEPLEWVQSIKKETNNFEKISAFSMFFGVIRPDVNIRKSLYLISNREEGVIKPFDDESRQIFGISNYSVFNPPSKVLQGESLFSNLTTNFDSAETIAASVFDLMSESTEQNLGWDDETYLQHTIFVPAVTRSKKGSYGTRTQTAIVVTKEANGGYSVLYQERNLPEKEPHTISFLIGGSAGAD